ncbi:MAG: hypothetical protein FJ215_11740 [Ignavibacteria bacterium]|nr:hypothetical protein [Ignavibacteria bacterium]
MHTTSKLLVLVASLLFVALYFVPLWQITMLAPQYPEGIGLYIWINEISGMRPNNLESMNILNHYIGMKAIVPESIPELRIMPYIAGFFILSGLVVVLRKKRSLLTAWLILLVVTGSVGLVDYYLWGYDYGHNLDPNAAIKIPGMAYQPPLIGTKQILNFRATSLPHLGGYLYLASILLAAVAWYLDVKRDTRANSQQPASAIG